MPVDLGDAAPDLHREMLAGAGQAGGGDRLARFQRLAGLEEGAQPGLRFRFLVAGIGREHREIMAQHLMGAIIPQGFGGGAEHADRAFLVHRQHRLGHGLDDRAQLRLAAAQRRLALLALGDVEHGADGADQIALGVVKGARRSLHRAHRSVALLEAVPEAEARRAIGDGRLDRLHHAFGILGLDLVAPAVEAGDGAGDQPQPLLRAGRPGEPAGGDVPFEHAHLVRRGGDREPLLAFAQLGHGAGPVGDVGHLVDDHRIAPDDLDAVDALEDCDLAPVPRRLHQFLRLVLRAAGQGGLGAFAARAEQEIFVLPAGFLLAPPEQAGRAFRPVDDPAVGRGERHGGDVDGLAQLDLHRLLARDPGDGPIGDRADDQHVAEHRQQLARRGGEHHPPREHQFQHRRQHGQDQRGGQQDLQHAAIVGIARQVAHPAKAAVPGDRGQRQRDRDDRGWQRSGEQRQGRPGAGAREQDDDRRGRGQPQRDHRDQAAHLLRHQVLHALPEPGEAEHEEHRGRIDAHPPRKAEAELVELAGEEQPVDAQVDLGPALEQRDEGDGQRHREEVDRQPPPAQERSHEAQRQADIADRGPGPDREIVQAEPAQRRKMEEPACESCQAAGQPEKGERERDSSIHGRCHP